MNKFFATAALMAFPLLCSAETWKNVSIIDVDCSAKVKASPDTHTRACALTCAKSGFGILTADGTYLKFDAQGNEKATAALNASHATDHLRVTVTGDRDGDVIKVKSLKM
jgi:hypothetical protein